MEIRRDLFSVNFYNKSEKIKQVTYPIAGIVSPEEVSVDYARENKENFTEINAVFTAKQKLSQAGVSMIFYVDGWKKENYVFAPAALYNGNRYKCLKKPYAPMFNPEEAKLCGDEPIITDVPRLELDGQGRAQLNTGDLATPCVGYFSKEEKRGVLWFWNQQNEAGNFGITVDEDCENNNISFILSAPCVREKTKYEMCTTEKKSDDRGIDLNVGDKLTFIVEEHVFDCENEKEFLNEFFNRRIRSFTPRSLPNRLPFSEAFSVIEDKYNERNWLENPGFYKSSEAEASIYRQWQTGWVGGTMNTLPGFIVGNDLSVERSKISLDFVFGKIQHESGFLYGIYCDGKVYGDSFESAENAAITMSRKNGDALYFLAKQIMFLKHENMEIKPEWNNGLKKLADAFVRYYRKNNSLDQFIDMDKFAPYAAGTASAAIAPAGLALCAEYFNEKEYLTAASEIAEDYYNKYVTRGFTNAGPGEILSCPDSESAFGMLESLIALYSATSDEKWLGYAKDTASLCASWCVSYDYKYEKDSQFGKRKIATSGAVWANVQNKHAAPGICTLSGASLFRLYRATGDIRYLDLCRDISHNITQFLSTEDDPTYSSYIWGGNPKLQKRLINMNVSFLLKMRKAGGLLKRITAPIYDKQFNKVGRMGERCNLSDWEGTPNVGELPGGSCWCEVSTLLTYLEIPAAYINPDKNFAYPIDHLKCEVKNGEITIENPTKYDASYRIFVENEADRNKPLDELFMLRYRTVKVPAHKKVTVKA